MLVLMLGNPCVPGARAEISRDLDPMVPVDYQATVTEEAPSGGTVATAGKMETEKTKKEKTKKTAVKKSSSKKKSKVSSKGRKAGKNSSR